MHYEMPTVLRMCVFLVCKLSFRLLWLNSGTVRRGQMPHNACKGHWEFRYNAKFIWQPAQIHILVQLCLAGTSMYQRCRVAKGILRVPNRRRSRYPHAGRQNAVYCQTLERLLIIKERKILQVEVPASYIQTFRCFWEEAFSSSSPTCTTLPAIHPTERSTLCFGTHICTLLFLPTVRPHQNP